MENITKTLLFKKLQSSSAILFADFDGTIYTAGIQTLQAPFINTWTKQILKQKHIPLVIVTGRAQWNIKSEIETMLLGLPQPDAVIAGAGTLVYYRTQNRKLVTDTVWETIIQKATVTWKNNKARVWDRKEIIEELQKQTFAIPYTILPLTLDAYLVRLYVKEVSIEKLFMLKKQIEALFIDGLQVVLTEKLFQKNTLHTFSGNILLLPNAAGKENAIKHILSTVIARRYDALRVRNDVHAYIFGDATIDVPMLLLKSVPKQYETQTYGVHLTPLANKLLREHKKENPQLTILQMHGPQAILKVMKQASESNHFSPAQNSIARRLLFPFETLLDNILDKNLSPNDISFLGLDVVKKSIDMLYDKKPNFITKCIALRIYFLGNLADLLDGIRARRVFLSPGERTKERGKTRTVNPNYDYNDIPGQLVDVFCDRAKEFYQLYKRAMFVIARSDKGTTRPYKRTNFSEASQSRDKQNPAYQILLAAISCILPSIARAQVEISGTVVKEYDTKGGSMIARTMKLFLSLLFDTIGMHNQSFTTDQKIYQTNMATFKNRLQTLQHGNPPRLQSRHPSQKGIKTPDIPSHGGVAGRPGWVTELQDYGKLTSFQQKALERFLLLVQILQEENEILEKKLQEYPEFLERYKKEFKKIIEDYLKIAVAKLRKEQKIRSYDLHMKENN